MQRDLLRKVELSNAFGGQPVLMVTGLADERTCLVEAHPHDEEDQASFMKEAFSGDGWSHMKEQQKDSRRGLPLLYRGGRRARHQSATTA